MSEKILDRNDFADIDIDNVAYIPYEIYQEIPTCFDYRYGKEQEMVLRNKITGNLERIKYRMVGAVPFSTRTGYHWYWGKIKSRDHNCCLAFYFKPSGKLNKITASFCGESLNSFEFNRRNRLIAYAAQITSFD